MAGHRARQVAIKQGSGIRDWGFALTAALVAAAALADPQVERQPTFRSEIDFVQIPVRVLDARGEFVKSLTHTEFKIEDGQPQVITAFNAVDIPSIAVDATVR
jgi:hypothetical protein